MTAPTIQAPNLQQQANVDIAKLDLVAFRDALVQDTNFDQNRKEVFLKCIDITLHALDALYGVHQIFGIPRLVSGHNIKLYLDSLLDKNDIRSMYEKSKLLSDTIKIPVTSTDLNTIEIKAAISNGFKQLDAFNFSSGGGRSYYGRMYSEILSILNQFKTFTDIQKVLTDDIANNNFKIKKLEEENQISISNLVQVKDENKRLKKFYKDLIDAQIITGAQVQNLII